jgi:hypothetical protein
MGTSKVSPIRAVMGFAAMIDALLVVLAGAVLKGLTGNAAFPNPTISLITFANDITIYSNAVAAALDGGKSAKAVRDKAKKVVVNDLRQLAMYVESNCNDDMATFMTSGFTAKAKPTASGAVGVPTIKWLDYGTHPGEILVSVKAVRGAKSYNLRYGPGTAPTSWTVSSVGSIRKAIPIDNLTSGTLYAFQVQALGGQGLSAWSDSSTIMCP